MSSTATITKDIAQSTRLRTVRPWYRVFYSPLWLCLLAALLLRVWLIVRTGGVIDGDEALVGIQAQRILRGQFPIYFYGQPYMGSLEAYLAALLFALFGASVWTLRAEPMLALTGRYLADMETGGYSGRYGGPFAAREALLYDYCCPMCGCTAAL